jgi:hypothetical protein
VEDDFSTSNPGLKSLVKQFKDRQNPKQAPVKIWPSSHSEEQKVKLFPKTTRQHTICLVVSSLCRKAEDSVMDKIEGKFHPRISETGREEIRGTVGLNEAHELNQIDKFKYRLFKYFGTEKELLPHILRAMIDGFAYR